MDDDRYYYDEYDDYDEVEYGGDDVQANLKTNEFIPLDDLVYAPLHALAKSSQQLRAYVVDAIKGMGTLKHTGQEETIQLNNINIAYEQIRQEGDEGYSVDNLQMQVPLLSIVPITSLNIEKAGIDFCTEVRAEKEAGSDCVVMARICAPEPRESDNLPRVSYQLKINSMPATEGIMRLADMLSTNHIAKKTDTTPVAIDGNLGGEEHKNTWQEVSKLKDRVKKLQRLYQKIADMIAEQEKLQEISRDAFSGETPDFNKDKYLAVQAQVASQIMEYREQIMDREIGFELEGDYE